MTPRDRVRYYLAGIGVCAKNIHNPVHFEGTTWCHRCGRICVRGVWTKEIVSFMTAWRRAWSTKAMEDMNFIARLIQ